MELATGLHINFTQNEFLGEIWSPSSGYEPQKAKKVTTLRNSSSRHPQKAKKMCPPSEAPQATTLGRRNK